MNNRFLTDFIKHQSTLIQSAMPEAEGGAGSGPTKKGRKKHASKHGTASGKHPFGGDDMSTRFTTLITEKPAKKEVLEYFKDRIAQLVAEDEY